MNIKNGTWVKMMSGDRDRVGEYTQVRNIEPSGRCEFVGHVDMCYGNIDEIGTPEQFTGEWWKTSPRLSYVLVDPLDVPTYLRNRM